MKFIHLADLHLGKRMYGYDLQQEQAYALEQIASLAAAKQVDAVVIAGDVYDSPQTSAEAMRLLDGFLTRLCKEGIEVIMIAGNHDHPDRLSFTSALLEESRIYIAGRYDGKDHRIERTDPFGQYVFHLVPFVRERDTLPACKATNTNEAFSYIRSQMELEEGKRHILVAHQFFGGSLSEGELRVGTIDQVDSSVLDGFDYACLGHLHGPQKVKADEHRYAGTLMAFSLPEKEQTKSICLVELDEPKTDTAAHSAHSEEVFKEENISCFDLMNEQVLEPSPGVRIRKIPLHPLRPVQTLEGTFAQLKDPEYVRHVNPEAFYDVILTDPLPIAGAAEVLRELYPRILHFSWPNLPKGTESISAAIENRTDEQLIDDFYKRRTEQEMSSYQKHLIETLWKEVQDETA